MEQIELVIRKAKTMKSLDPSVNPLTESLVKLHEKDAR